jgi:hypothetical protein
MASSRVMIFVIAIAMLAASGVVVVAFLNRGPREHREALPTDKR